MTSFWGRETLDNERINVAMFFIQPSDFKIEKDILPMKDLALRKLWLIQTYHPLIRSFPKILPLLHPAWKFKIYTIVSNRTISKQAQTPFKLNEQQICKCHAICAMLVSTGSKQSKKQNYIYTNIINRKYFIKSISRERNNNTYFKTTAFIIPKI